MTTISNFKPLFIITLAISFVCLHVGNVNAHIYKWRNNNGVVQYADNLPNNPDQALYAAKNNHQADAAIKTEILKLNIQNKQTVLCDIALIDAKNGKKSSNKNTDKLTNYQADFFGFSKAVQQKLLNNNTPFNAVKNIVNLTDNANINLASPLSFFGFNKNSVNNLANNTIANAVANQYLPLNSNAFFNWGGKTVTVFGQPTKVAENIKPKPLPTSTTPLPTMPAPIPVPVAVPKTSSVANPQPAPVSAVAATGKVFYIAINGNNNNPGTEALPWRNLNHAVYAMRAGETVLVKNGTYQESLYINRSGSVGKPISYRAYPGHTPKIEINRKELEGILIQGVSYIIVEGFEVVYTAPGAAAAKGEQTDNGIDISNAGQVLPHHITIKNNKVHGFPGGGIFTVLADYVTFEGNTVWENALWAKWGNSGISMYQNVNFDQVAGYHMIIRGNTLYKNENKLASYAIGSTTITDGNCIIIDDLRHTQKFLDNKTPYPAYKSNTLIENNICYDNGARGIHVYSSDHVLVRHNTLYKNQRTASINDGELTAFDASNVRFVNNIVYATAGKKANGTYNASNIVFDRNLYFGSDDIANKSATDIIADPLFVNASINPTIANFSLKVGSPAIDKALAGQSPTFDIAGKARPLGAAADIGAYEVR